VGDPGINHVAARGFERAGQEYERGRPGYPPEAIALLVHELGLGPERTIVDLAAGTGKLTRALVGTGARLIAVEPVAGMRAQLVAAVPQAEALEGTAEAIPVPDDGADTVLVAQAFHWFDAPRAAREIYRVLVPGGGLGVIWNEWDESVDWVGQMQEMVHAYAGDAPRAATTRWPEQLAASGLFGALFERAFLHVVTGDLDALSARVSSVSYISALEDDEREHFLQTVRALVATHPQTRGLDRLPMPYTARVAWCRARA
jgi:ubiquinone/menaquinone biosynthesis C-methylase UbiE